MLSLHLTPLFQARNIDRPFTFLVNNGFSRNAAHNLIHGNNRVLRLDQIEKLCHLLVCDLHDIMRWTPPTQQAFPADYPLRALIKEQAAPDIRETLSTTPYHILKAVNQAMIEQARQARKSGEEKE